MRVVGGVARGRRLRAPAGGAIRPTSDFVREAVFDTLASLDAVAGGEVVDLFAGTGAMGIEALSRRAAGVTFVDHDPRAIQIIRANLVTAGFLGTAGLPPTGGPLAPRGPYGAGRSIRVVRADVLAWLGGPLAAQIRGCDLVLCDPPYRFSAWAELLCILRTGLEPALAVLETAQPIEPPGGWEILRIKRYGGTVVTVVRLLSQRGDL